MLRLKDQLINKNCVNLQKVVKENLNTSEIETEEIGGFLKNGSLAWIVNGSTIEIFSTETGTRTSYCNFSKCLKTKNCTITCVEEISHYPNLCILAVAVEFSMGTGGMISIFCVQGSKILGSMDFCEKITSIRHISKDACRKSVLRQFHGCIAIGTDQGKVFLIDIMLPPTSKDVLNMPSQESELFLCCNVLANIEQSQIGLQHREIARENSYFSIQLEVLDDSSAVLSILCLPNLFTLAVGLVDGRLVLYDLKDLQAFHLAYPPSNRAPLMYMSYLEPIDDPRSYVYIWTFHASQDGAIAVLHSLMYENKVNSVYENFKSCNVRLTMPMFEQGSVPISCRSVRKIVSQDEEDVIILNLLAWTVPSSSTTNVLIFDLNQWYKEEMPSFGDWRQFPNYVTSFSTNESTTFDVMINEQSVFPFNSIQRPEEHFYPNSLSFEISFLENNKFKNLYWPGIQNAILEQFQIIGPQMVLEPTQYYNQMLKAAIHPQFYDVLFNALTSTDLKREFLLSVALEYNFTGFLRKCAWSWADGSYLGKDTENGLSLSTLTEWIWNRAKSLKEICNSLCLPLFDYSERRIDYGTQKMLSQCCRQLKSLSELLHVIVNNYKKFIPENVLTLLNNQSESIKMASEYQEVLQWLLNVGLLPEGLWRSDSALSQENSFKEEDEFLIVPYPYCVINSFYMTQRMKFAEDYLTRSQEERESSCRYLFIDTFIERECNPEEIHSLWKENSGNGLYPPSSIQTLLRTLLISDISTENKYILFVYLFMDINSILNEGNKGRYSSIVQNLIKFPTVFKLDSAVIKRTQAFWNLDNGHLEMAVEELISPLSHDRHLQTWQRELLISSLLKQNANSLALRALRAPGKPISTKLEIETLLANGLLSEALRIQRSSGDRSLLEMLFDKMLNSSKCDSILDLSLTEVEGQILRNYLEKADLPNNLNMHFVFLLQRSKFTDAVSLIDKMSRHKDNGNFNLEAPKELLSAYHATMEPTTRHLTYMTYTEKEKFHCGNKEEVAKTPPLPLSRNLIQSKLNVTNNIYQKSIQTINEVGYGENLLNIDEEDEMPFIGCPKLGIFEYHQQPPQLRQNDSIFPFEINEHGKRLHDERPRKLESAGDFGGSILFEDYLAPYKKRRKLNAQTQRKSYKDMNLNVLTNFRDVKPSYHFHSNSSRSTSKQTTPERGGVFRFQQQQDRSTLSTPIIKKRLELTPEKSLNTMTPTSILKSKTTSLRTSVSPTPSRISEFEEKSIKSITFAMPGTNESSLNLDDSEGSQMSEPPNESSSSADNFFSPNSSLVEEKESRMLNISGPKPRPALRSRSNTPSFDQEMRSRSVTPVCGEIRSKTPLEEVQQSKKIEDAVTEENRPVQEPIITGISSRTRSKTPVPEISETIERSKSPARDTRSKTPLRESRRSKTPSKEVQFAKEVQIQPILSEIIEEPETPSAKSKTPPLETPGDALSYSTVFGAKLGPSVRKSILKEETSIFSSKSERVSFNFFQKREVEITEQPGASGIQDQASEAPEKEEAFDEEESPQYSPLNKGSVLKDSSSSMESSQDSSAPDLTIYGKSILGSDFDKTYVSDSDEDESKTGEQLPKNILPSDSDEDSDEDQGEVLEEHKSSGAEEQGEEEFEYGDINVNDSDSEESNIYDSEDLEDDQEEEDGDEDIEDIGAIDSDESESRSPKIPTPPDSNTNSSDVIEILSSSEDEDRNFDEVQEIKNPIVPQKLPLIDCILPQQENKEIEDEAKLSSMLYDDIDKSESEGDNDSHSEDLYDLKPSQSIYENVEQQEIVTTTVEIPHQSNLEHEHEVVIESHEPEIYADLDDIQLMEDVEKVEDKLTVLELNKIPTESYSELAGLITHPNPSTQTQSQEVEIQISMVSDATQATSSQTPIEIIVSQESEKSEPEKVEAEKSEQEKVELKVPSIQNLIENVTSDFSFTSEAGDLNKAVLISNLTSQGQSSVKDESLADSSKEAESKDIEMKEDLKNIEMEEEITEKTESVDTPEESEMVEVVTEGTAEAEMEKAENVEKEQKETTLVQSTSEASTSSAGKLNEAVLISTTTDLSDFKGFEVSQVTNENSQEVTSSNNLNIAVIHSESIEKTIPIERGESSKSNLDSQDRLNVAVILSSLSSNIATSTETAQEPEVVVENTRKLRGKSSEPTEVAERRTTRAKSVPKVLVSSPKLLRSRRVSADDPQNPKTLLKEKFLEKIEEDVEAPSTPTRLTRRRSIATPTREIEDPGTPTRGTRRKSMMSDDGNDTPSKRLRRVSMDAVDTPGTPRRLTRAASRELLATPKSILGDLEETSPKKEEDNRSEKSVRSTRSTKKKQEALETTPKKDDDNRSEKSVKSTKSTRSTKKKQEAIIEEEEGKRSTRKKSKSVERSPVSSQEEISTTTRRLTRAQLAVLEKSKKLQEKITASQLSTRQKFVQSESEGSDEEKSVKSSTASTKSKKRGRRRKASQSDEESSIASSKEESPKKVMKLSVIPEESREIDEEMLEKSRQTRTKK